MKSKGISLLLFFIVFGLAKFCVFFGPLLLASQLSIIDYGLIEYTLALGSIMAIFFNTGVSTSYPYFVLKRGLSHFKPYFYIHPVIVSFIFLPAGALFIGNLFDSRYFFGLLIGFVTANQILISTKQKSHEDRISAVLLESGVFVLLTVFALLLAGNFLKSTSSFYWIIFVYYLIFFLFFINNLKKIKEPFSTISRYKKILQYGIPIVFSSVAVVLFTTIGRIIVEWLLGIDKVGVYAFYFRLASVVIIIYQIVNVLFFKKIYTFQLPLLDKYFSVFLFGILFIGFFFYFTIHFFGQEIFSLLNWEVKEENKLIHLLFVFQMVFWISLALNENIIYRENLAKNVSIRLLFLVVLMFLCFAILDYILILSLQDIIFIHISFMFIALEVQFYVIRQKLKESFFRSQMVVIGLYLCLVGLCSFLVF